MTLKQDMQNIHDAHIFEAVADEVEYTPQGGSMVPLSAVFEGQFSLLEMDNGIPVESHVPAVCFQSSDVPNIAHGDAVRAEGADYLVHRLKPTKDGLVWAILEVA